MALNFKQFVHCEHKAGYYIPCGDSRDLKRSKSVIFKLERISIKHQLKTIVVTYQRARKYRQANKQRQRSKDGGRGFGGGLSVENESVTIPDGKTSA